jgi:hypothetical protein
MVNRAAWLVPSDEYVNEEDFSPADPAWVEPPADPLDLNPAALLAWADALPPDGLLVDVLLSIDATNLGNKSTAGVGGDGRDRRQARDSVRRGGHVADARPMRARRRANPGECDHAHAGRAATAA